MEKFQWGNITAIFWLSALIPILLVHIYGHRQRKFRLRKIMPVLSERSLPDFTSCQARRNFKAVCILGVFFFSALALMEPKYDFTYETIERKGIDLIVALDVSRSMYATDISPSRFERSILEIKNLVQSLSGDRVGLILFTSKAVTQCPLTLDYSTFKLLLDEVEVGILPRGGTNLAGAVEQAVKSFDPRYKKERALILISDGESHTGNLDGALENAEMAGLTIYTVGLGSKEGVPILIPGSQSEKQYVKDDQGNIVLSRMNDTDLKKAALMTGGAYVHAGSGDFQLDKLYQEHILPLEGRELEMHRKKRYEHRFYLPLGVALFLLVLETLLGDRKNKNARMTVGNAS